MYFHGSGKENLKYITVSSSTLTSWLFLSFKKKEIRHVLKIIILKKEMSGPFPPLCKSITLRH